MGLLPPLSLASTRLTLGHFSVDHLNHCSPLPYKITVCLRMYRQALARVDAVFSFSDITAVPNPHLTHTLSE